MRPCAQHSVERSKRPRRAGQSRLRAMEAMQLAGGLEGVSGSVWPAWPAFDGIPTSMSACRKTLRQVAKIITRNSESKMRCQAFQQIRGISQSGGAVIPPRPDRIRVMTRVTMSTRAGAERMAPLSSVRSYASVPLVRRGDSFPPEPANFAESAIEVSTRALGQIHSTRPARIPRIV